MKIVPCIILHMQHFSVIQSDTSDIFRLLTGILKFCVSERRSVAHYASFARGSAGLKRLKDPHLHVFDPSRTDVSCEFYFIKIYVSL